MAMQQNFQRTMSKVWWMNDTMPNTMPNTITNNKSIHENHLSIKSQVILFLVDNSNASFII